MDKVTLEKINNDVKEFCNCENKLLSNKNFKTANIIGEYAEILICYRLKLTRAKTNAKFFDALDSLGKKYQIKARLNRLQTKSKGQDEFGSVKKNEDGKFGFDFLILVYFINNVDNYEVYKIKSDDIDKSISYIKNNRYIFRRNSKRFKDNIGKKIEKEF